MATTRRPASCAAAILRGRNEDTDAAVVDILGSYVARAPTDVSALSGADPGLRGAQYRVAALHHPKIEPAGSAPNGSEQCAATAAARATLDCTANALDGGRRTRSGSVAAPASPASVHRSLRGWLVVWATRNVRGLCIGGISDARQGACNATTGASPFRDGDGFCRLGVAESSCSAACGCDEQSHEPASRHRDDPRRWSSAALELSSPTLQMERQVHGQSKDCLLIEKDVS